MQQALEEADLAFPPMAVFRLTGKKRLWLLVAADAIVQSERST